MSFAQPPRLPGSPVRRLLLHHRLAVAIVCLAASLTAAQSQEPVPLESAAYFPDAEDDSWLYSVPAGADDETTEQRTLHASEALEGDRLRIDGSDGSLRVLQTSARSGWSLVEEATLGGRRLVFEEPLLLLPARTETGATHEVEGRYRVLLDEDVVDTGTVRATVSIGALAQVEAPAGTFDDCLQLDVLLEFASDEDPETLKASRRQLWRARGVGLVRELSGASVLDVLLPQDEGTEPESRDWLLVEAAVGGTLVTGAEDPRPEIDLGAFEPPPR